MVQLSLPAPPVASAAAAPGLVLADGTPVSWGDLYCELGPALLAYARSRGVRDPEDLVQEVFVDVSRCFDGFIGDRAGLRSLVFTIAYRRIADNHRRDARRREILVARVREKDCKSVPPSCVEDDVVSSETTSAALQALSILNDREQQVVRMRIIEEASPQEVSRRLGLTNVNVRVIQARAFRKVRAFLEAEGHLRHPLATVMYVSSLRDFGVLLPSDGVLANWIRDLRAAGARDARSVDVLKVAHPTADTSWMGVQFGEVGSSLAPAVMRLVVASAIAVGAATLVVSASPQVPRTTLQSWPDSVPAATSGMPPSSEMTHHPRGNLTSASDNDSISEHASAVTTQTGSGSVDPSPAPGGPSGLLTGAKPAGIVDPLTGSLILLVTDVNDTLSGLLSSLAEEVTGSLTPSSIAETLADTSGVVSEAVEATRGAADTATTNVLATVGQSVDDSIRASADTTPEVGSDRPRAGMGETVADLADTAVSAAEDVAVVADSLVDDLVDGGLGLFD